MDTVVVLESSLPSRVLSVAPATEFDSQPKGDLRTCLYGKGALNFRDLLRAGASNEDIKSTLIQALGKRAKDGFEAEKNRGILNPASESMATIGG